MWKAKLIILLAIAVPAVTGLHNEYLNFEIMPGLTVCSFLYLLLVNTIICVFLGSKAFANVLAFTTLVGISVVFLGATVHCLLDIKENAIKYGPYYLSLFIRMWTYIPLAIACINVIPFHSLEDKILISGFSVSFTKKIMLLVLRVVNHVIHSVIPVMLEIKREEATNKFWKKDVICLGNSCLVEQKTSSFLSKSKAIINDFIGYGIEIISASIQHIPLWAIEISYLPTAKSKRGN